MGKHKNKELKNKINQTLIQGAGDPWAVHQSVQEHLRSMGMDYSKRSKADSVPKKTYNMPDYDMTQLMDKLGGKMPPGVKHMMEQFMSIIPNEGAMDSPNFKKEMKKKMKGFSSVFKSPYE